MPSQKVTCLSLLFVNCLGLRLKLRSKNNTTVRYTFIHSSRTKVDMNRDVIEGSQGNPVATAAYEYYHECIKRAKSSTNRGILFDLHGQVLSIRFL